MLKHIRWTLFVTYVVALRPIVWTILWLIGLTGTLKTIFLIYPTDTKEFEELCPDYKWFLKFGSGRPTPGGLIFNGWRPVGVYLFISNSPQELIKKKNRHIAESIATRMRWIQKLCRAEACGFAGQLGPILERRHGIAMEPPFFSSTLGNVFSIDDAVAHLSTKAGKMPWELKMAILGGGEFGETLQRHFADKGYGVEVVDVQFKRRGGVSVKDLETATRQVEHVDFVVNVLPTGDDFLHCGIADSLDASVSVIDFSRPAIPQHLLQATVYKGNRIQCPGMRFAFSLPGEWKSSELPACSLPSLLASNFGVVEQEIDKFCRAARNASFATGLAPSVQPEPTPLFADVKEQEVLF